MDAVGSLIGQPWILRSAAVALGAGVGLTLHRVVGCKTATCPLIANRWASVLYGAFLGAMMSS